MSKPATGRRSVLITKFPKEFTTHKVLPALKQVGFEPRVEGVKFCGSLADIDVLIFLQDMCGGSDYGHFRDMAKKAGIKFLSLPRRTVDWPQLLQRAGIAVPLGAVGLLQEPPPVSIPARLQPFGITFEIARETENFTYAQLAELLGVTEDDVVAWEAEEAPVPLPHYQALLDLFPLLATAEKPEVVMLTMGTAPPAVIAADPPAPMTPRAPLPSVPSAPAPSPLSSRSVNALVAGLRALGVTEPFTIRVFESGAEAFVAKEGGYAWKAESADEVIDMARKDVAGRRAAHVADVQRAIAQLA